LMQKQLVALWQKYIPQVESNLFDL
jgi:hypothetical protein